MGGVRAGVIDEHVDAIQRLRRPAPEIVNLLRAHEIRDVGGNVAAAGVFNGGHGAGQAVRTAAGERHPRAGLRERNGGGRPNAPSGSRDQRDFPVQPFHASLRLGASGVTTARYWLRPRAVTCQTASTIPPRTANA